MPKPQTYRTVELPDEWETYPPNAKVNYLSTVMDRDQLLQVVGELASIPDDEIGAQSIHKSGLAQLIVTIVTLEQERDDA